MRALAIAAVSLDACHVPDAAAPRATYIGMASIDAALVAAVPTTLVCLWPAHRDSVPRKCAALTVGLSAAAGVATGIALANQDSDREPDASEWIVVGGPAVFVTGAVLRAVIAELFD